MCEPRQTRLAGRKNPIVRATWIGSNRRPNDAMMVAATHRPRHPNKGPSIRSPMGGNRPLNSMGFDAPSPTSFRKGPSSPAPNEGPSFTWRFKIVGDVFSKISNGRDYARSPNCANDPASHPPLRRPKSTAPLVANELADTLYGSLVFEGCLGLSSSPTKVFQAFRIRTRSPTALPFSIDPVHTHTHALATTHTHTKGWL